MAAGAAAEMGKVAGSVEVEEWIDRWMLVWWWERLLALWGLTSSVAEREKISSGKVGLCFWCCFSVTNGGRVEGKLREKMDDGEGKGRVAEAVWVG